MPNQLFLRGKQVQSKQTPDPKILLSTPLIQKSSKGSGLDVPSALDRPYQSLSTEANDRDKVKSILEEMRFQRRLEEFIWFE